MLVRWRDGATIDAFCVFSRYYLYFKIEGFCAQTLVPVARVRRLDCGWCCLSVAVFFEDFACLCVGVLALSSNILI